MSKKDQIATSAKTGTEYPLIISFYYGDDYYQHAADQLKKDCEALGLDYEIVEAPLAKGTNWIQACRYKIVFIQQCLKKFKRPVLWVDVDGRLLAKPEVLRQSSVDFAFFLHNFRYLREYDPIATPRFMQPAILYFGYTKKAREFVDLMAKIEKDYSGEATDAYFVQEAWQHYDKPLSLLLFAPDLVTEDLSKKSDSYFYIARSGNVSAFKDLAEQHEPDVLAPARRKAVLLKEALESTKAGNLQATLTYLRRASEHDPTDEVLAQRVARLLKRLHGLRAAVDFLSSAAFADKQTDYVQRFVVDAELEAGNLDAAEKAITMLISHGSKSDSDWAKSRSVRLGLEKRARQLGISDADRPKVWWMESPYPGNFGDILNPYIIEKLSGIPPKHTPAGAGILAIGSVIKFAKKGTDVWGTGTPRMTDRLSDTAHYHAVRGPLSRQLVIESGGTCPEIYGDAAWFLPVLYTPKIAARKYKLGIILHYVNEEDVTADESVKVIKVIRDGSDGIEQFIDELNQCEKILTTSLHGLIVSHAYGIPAEWCQITGTDTNLAGDGTKFHDYMLSVGISPKPSLKIAKGTHVTAAHAKKVSQLPITQIDLKALAQAAPFDILPKWGFGTKTSRKTTAPSTHVAVTAPAARTTSTKHQVKAAVKRLDSKLGNPLAKAYRKVRR